MSRATSKYGDYRAHNEWQFTTKGTPFKTIWHKRAKIGEIQKLPSGQIVCWLFSSIKEIKYAGAPSVQIGIYPLLRTLGVTLIGIIDDVNNTYTITIADFDANKQSKPVDPSFKAKDARYYVPTVHWSFKSGNIESLEDSLKVGKWK